MTSKTGQGFMDTTVLELRGAAPGPTGKTEQTCRALGRSHCRAGWRREVTDACIPGFRLASLSLLWELVVQA